MIRTLVIYLPTDTLTFIEGQGSVVTITVHASIAYLCLVYVTFENGSRRKFFNVPMSYTETPL